MVSLHKINIFAPFFLYTICMTFALWGRRSLDPRIRSEVNFWKIEKL